MNYTMKCTRIFYLFTRLRSNAANAAMCAPLKKGEKNTEESDYLN